jgi:hypothetical protein
VALGAVPALAATGGAGVVNSDGTVPAGQGIVFSSPMRFAGATWYGPGLYGNHTACGQTLLPGTVGVAHKTLPCGTTIKFAYHGHYLVTRVIDRGPYTEGNAFDRRTAPGAHWASKASTMCATPSPWAPAVIETKQDFPV